MPEEKSGISLSQHGLIIWPLLIFIWWAVIVYTLFAYDVLARESGIIVLPLGIVAAFVVPVIAFWKLRGKAKLIVLAAMSYGLLALYFLSKSFGGIGRRPLYQLLFFVLAGSPFIAFILWRISEKMRPSRYPFLRYVTALVLAAILIAGTVLLSRLAF